MVYLSDLIEDKSQNNLSKNYDEFFNNLFAKEPTDYKYPFYLKVKDAFKSINHYLSQKIGKAVIKIMFPFF